MAGIKQLKVLGALTSGIVLLSACGADRRESVVIEEERNRIITPVPSTSQQTTPGTATETAPQTTAESPESMPGGTERIQIISLAESVNPGQQVQLEVQAAPNTRVTVDTRGAAQDLQTKTTDQSGRASWSWTVNRNYRADLIPVVVTATDSSNNRRAIMTKTIKIDRMNTAQREELNGRITDMKRTARVGDEILVTVEAEPGTKVKAEAFGIDGGPRLSDKTISQDGKATWRIPLDRNYKGDKFPLLITLQKGNVEQVFMEEIRVDDRTAATDQPGSM